MCNLQLFVEPRNYLIIKFLVWGRLREKCRSSELLDKNVSWRAKQNEENIKQSMFDEIFFAYGVRFLRKCFIFLICQKNHNWINRTYLFNIVNSFRLRNKFVDIESNLLFFPQGHGLIKRNVSWIIQVP